MLYNAFYSQSNMLLTAKFVNFVYSDFWR